jgi:DNA-binding GntR family transcriptional regulator
MSMSPSPMTAGRGKSLRPDVPGGAADDRVPSQQQDRLATRRRPWVSMVDIAYDALLEAIFDRHFEPGARLEIRDVALRLGMSPTPVREALARLTTQGLTVLDANRGCHVAGLLTPTAFHDLYAARRVIELGALRGGGPPGHSESWLQCVSDGQINEVRRLERQVGTSPHGARYADYADFARADSEFHRGVVALVGNQFLEAAWTGLYVHLHVSRLYAGTGVIDFDEAGVEHAAILGALEQRNADNLVEAALSHIDRAESRLASLLT